jgi:hypothetical protein
LQVRCRQRRGGGSSGDFRLPRLVGPHTFAANDSSADPESDTPLPSLCRFIVCIAIALSGGVAGCSTRDSTADSARAALAELTAEQAIVRARQFMVQQNTSAPVYLDSAAVTAVDEIWRVTFRRRALVVPAVVTVDVNRRTGAARFPGDE